MTSITVHSETLAIMKDILHADVTEQTTSGTCKEWDSLRYVELAAALEDHFGIHFTAEELVQLDSFSNITAILETKLA